MHRHPPFNGLGSNTCVQDAFNLAWKVSYVTAGKAGPRLLDSFSTERQPVGVDIVTRANQGLRDHTPWLRAIGMLEHDVSQRCAIYAEFDEPGDKGRRRRDEFQQGIEQTSDEFHGLGVEMNQFYVSDAIYGRDENVQRPAEKDSVQTYHITTLPGSRLPHAWLNSRTPGEKLSTIDLAGHGNFNLFTGPGGSRAWKGAAKIVSSKLGLDIGCYSIGWKQDYEDVYFDWARRREVEEDGCVLVRPDRFVAWRSMTMVSECEGKLESVMRAILDR